MEKNCICCQNMQVGVKLTGACVTSGYVVAGVGRCKQPQQYEYSGILQFISIAFASLQSLGDKPNTLYLVALQPISTYFSFQCYLPCSDGKHWPFSELFTHNTSTGIYYNENFGMSRQTTHCLAKLIILDPAFRIHNLFKYVCKYRCTSYDI